MKDPVVILARSVQSGWPIVRGRAVADGASVALDGSGKRYAISLSDEGVNRLLGDGLVKPGDGFGIVWPTAKARGIYG